MDATEFEDAVATCNLLPGPASTQLSIYCEWRVRGRLGALVGGAAFILPGLVVILALSALFLEGSPPRVVIGAGAGAGAAVAAVAVQAGASLIPSSWSRRDSTVRGPLTHSWAGSPRRPSGPGSSSSCSRAGWSSSWSGGAPHAARARRHASVLAVGTVSTGARC